MLVMVKQFLFIYIIISVFLTELTNNMGNLVRKHKSENHYNNSLF